VRFDFLPGSAGRPPSDKGRFRGAAIHAPGSAPRLPKSREQDIGIAGSKVMSMAPVFASLYKTFSQVLPPSRVRKLLALRYRRKDVPERRQTRCRDSSGSQSAARWRAYRQVNKLPVLPASMDLYTPFPPTMLPRMQASPVPTYMTLDRIRQQRARRSKARRLLFVKNRLPIKSPSVVFQTPPATPPK